MGQLKVEFRHNQTSHVLADLEKARARASNPTIFKHSPNVVTEGIDIVDDYKGKTVLRVFDKKKFEKAMDTASLIVTVKGIVKAVVETIGAVWSKVQTTTSSAFKSFSSTWGFVPDGIETLPAIYSLYDNGIHLVKAVRNSNAEEVRDRSAGVSTASLTIAGTAIGVASYVEASNKSAAIATQGVALGVASGALGCVIWGISAVIQAVSIKRVWNRIAKIKHIFASSIETENQKIRSGIKEIRSQLEISQKEELKIQSKAKGDPRVVKRERARLLEAKVIKLKKRVGEDFAEKIKSHIFQLSKEVDATDGNLSPHLIGRAKRLLKGYKRALNKQMSIRIMNFAGTVIGFVGAVIAFTTPIGAAILSGIAAGVLIYSWYKTNYSKSDDYKKVTLFGVKTNWFHYEIEPIESSIYAAEEEEEMHMAKKALLETDALLGGIRDVEEERGTGARKREEKLDEAKVVPLDTYRVVADESHELEPSMKPKRVFHEDVASPMQQDPREIEKARYKALMKRIQERSALILGPPVEVL